MTKRSNDKKVEWQEGRMTKRSNDKKVKWQEDQMSEGWITKRPKKEKTTQGVEKWEGGRGMWAMKSAE